MFIVILKLDALPKKCLELRQTLQALNKSTPKDK